MKTKLALFAILVVVGQAYAQDYAFKVLANKGKNELKAGDSWQQLKVGTTLKKDDELRIAENAYLGLVHSTGKAIEVRKAGKYKVIDLAKEIKEPANVLNKYTDFILSSNTGPKNTLAATGAVDRGGSAIKVYLPRPELAIVYGDKVTINWEEDKSLSPYVVMFKSMFGDELASMETSDNFLTVDLGNKSFMNEDNIIVTVESKTNKNKISDEYTLKRLSKADKERIKTEYAKIAATTSEPTAINKMAIAAFFEQNNLLIDAIPYYQEAIKLAPDVPDYKDFYNDFLLRYGIKSKK
ncbi:hypothetical protein WBG78_12420 [Chryseolinea sp. T2]|uniref:hypothetical protein n=1 Tax=Chryseolinea sp. T2 TaxID=3129255 RepID=UPI003076C903